MTDAQVTVTIQQIIQMIDKNKGLPTFKLAQQIFKEIIEDLLEDERQIWMSLAYAKRPYKNSGH